MFMYGDVNLRKERYGFILTSDIKWWEKLCQKAKSGSGVYSFVRRSSVGPIHAEKLLFYVKHPLMQVRGIADFIERIADEAEVLWRRYGEETCLGSFESFCEFLGGRDKATFIRFTGFRELKKPVSMDVLKKVLGISRIPRGGKYVSREEVNQLIALE
jgi:predicted transcriptional regulator